MKTSLYCSRAGKSALAGASSRGDTAVLWCALLILLCGWLANAGAADITPEVFKEADIESGAKPLADEVDIDDIHFGPEGCTYKDPEITISPSKVPWEAPGTALEYTVIVTNTSSYSCDITNFDLSVTAPAGWDVELDNQSLQIAPGWSTGVFDMVITSPTRAQNGRYEIAVSASSRLLSLETTATAVYMVESASAPPPVAPQPGTATAPGRDVIQTTMNDADPVASYGAESAAADTCVRSAPKLRMSPALHGRKSGAGFSYTISLSNNDTPACAGSRFDLTLTFLPAGWKGHLSSRQLNLAPGRTGRAILVVTPPSTVASGRYQLQVGVSDVQYAEHAMTLLASQVPGTATSP